MPYLVDRNVQLSYLMVEMDKDKYEIEKDPYGGKIPPATLPHTSFSLEDEYVDPPLLTNKIINQAEEEAKVDDGKPLFLFPETPTFNMSRAESRMSLNGMGTFDVLNSVLSVTNNYNTSSSRETMVSDDIKLDIDLEDIPENEIYH